MKIVVWTFCCVLKFLREKLFDYVDIATAPVLIDGKDAGIHGIQDAKAAGINIIHQELVLVPYLSVAENIFLNREPVKGGMVDYGKMYEMAQKFIDSEKVRMEEENVDQNTKQDVCM